MTIQTRETAQALGPEQVNSMWRDSGGYKWKYDFVIGWQMWNGKTWTGCYAIVDGRPPYFEIFRTEPPPPAEGGNNATPAPALKKPRKPRKPRRPKTNPPDNAA
jgi:hypothetical protein